MKLNLGSGSNPKPDYCNVDKYGDPDVRHDLEQFPWPWDDSTIDEIRLNHILEHIGETTKIYLGIIQEIYRVCKPDAKIEIIVPHPRHDDFLNDPTHVRVITPDSLTLFSKRANCRYIEMGAANSTLGIYLDVDFEIERTRFCLEEPWKSQFDNEDISVDELNHAVKKYNNVIKETEIILRVIK